MPVLSGAIVPTVLSNGGRRCTHLVQLRAPSHCFKLLHSAPPLYLTNNKGNTRQSDVFASVHAVCAMIILVHCGQLLSSSMIRCSAEQLCCVLLHKPLKGGNGPQVLHASNRTSACNVKQHFSRFEKSYRGCRPTTHRRAEEQAPWNSIVLL